MRTTTRKSLRDLWRQRAQVIAVAVTIMLGVALFIASAGAFRNLSDSYVYTYDRLGFAGATGTGGDPDSIAAAARAAGAAAVATRTQVDPPMLIHGTKLLGRVIGLPPDRQPSVDLVHVVAGDYLAPGTGVLVEKHAAQTFGLTTGDTVSVFTSAGWQTATVRGIVVSAEYIWPARSRQDVLSDPKSFAVLFAPEQTVQHWFGTGPNQVLATLPAPYGAGRTGSAAAQRESELVAAMRAAGAADVYGWQDQPSHATLQEDLDGFSELSVAFPFLFLTAAAIAGYVLLARRVFAERPTIGALMASGARRSRLVRHYLQQGTLVGAIGSVLGGVLGVVLTRAVTEGYTKELGIPDTVVAFRPDLVTIGVVVGVLIGALGALAPAITAARTVPAEAMRNETVAWPPGWWSRLVARMRLLPVSWRMALRDVFRNVRRTLATMLGTTLALVLVLAAAGMLTSFSDAIQVQYDQIERQDATVVIDARSTNDPAGLLRGVPGVAVVEQVTLGRVTATNGSDSYTTMLSGYPSDTRMHRFRGTNGQWLDPPASGVLAGAALADRLHLHVGDTIDLTASNGGRTAVRLEGLLAEPLGTAIYADRPTADAVLGQSPVDSFMLRFDPGADREKMRRALTTLDGVVSYADSKSLTNAIDQYLGLVWAFIAVMILLGGVLAFTVIYVTMAVNLVERTNELATLRATGVRLRRVAGVLVAENVTATLLGIPIGLALGVLAAQAFLASFSNDLFRIQLHLSWWALPAAALGVLLAALFSQLPAVRSIRKMDIARVVRERAR